MNDIGLPEKLLDVTDVEWKPLGRLGQLVRGNGLPKSDFTESGVPAIHYGQIYTTYGLFTRSTISFVSSETASTLQKVDMGDVIITNTSENFEDVGTPLVYLGTQQAVTGGHATIFKSDGSILGMYLAYFTQTPTFENAKRKYAKGTKVIDVSAKDLAKIHIPIPCPNDPKKSLAIQAEIVRILDNFTELTSELTLKLTAELEARKKQYKYYRETLFTFEDGEANYMTLGDERLGAFTRGGGLQKKDFVEDGIGCIHYGQIYTHYGTFTHSTKSFVTADFARKAKMAKRGDLVIATTSENDDDVCKAVAWLGENEIAVSSDACFYAHNLNPKYVSYFFQTEQFQKQKRPYITGTKVRRVNVDSLAKIMIPVPKQEGKQDHIVRTLDKFAALTTSLSEGLQREIELRNQQYEYYRDLLLNFPEPARVAEA